MHRASHQDDIRGLAGISVGPRSGLRQADPADRLLPYGITKVVDVNKIDMVRQNVAIVPDTVLQKHLQIRVNCRLAMPEVTPSAGASVDVQEYREIGLIAPDTAKLVVTLE
jgi:hypothetical protein